MFTCVFCSKQYDPRTARAEFRGLCSMKCQHEMARKYGYKNPKFGPTFNYTTFRSEWHCISEPLRLLRAKVPGADPLESK